MFIRTKSEVSKDDRCIGVDSNETAGTSGSSTSSGTVEKGESDRRGGKCTCTSVAGLLF
jgi:hypothetical protein